MGGGQGRELVFVSNFNAHPHCKQNCIAVCGLKSPGQFATAKGNVYYSCEMLRAVDFNCFSKCEDNCDIWKRWVSCTNKLCFEADLVHTVPFRLLYETLPVPWGAGKERKDLRHALPGQRSEPG